MTHSADMPPTALLRDTLSATSDKALSSLEARTSHSWKMALDRAHVLPDTIDVAGAPALHVFVRSANGCRVTDLDGNTYIDLCMGFGTQMLGHGHPTVHEAIITQAARGWNFGLPGDGQLAYGHLIQAAGPANERVMLCNSGSDATLYAMRAARAFTGRDVIGVFTNSYHGTHDYGLVAGAGEGSKTRKVHLGAGVPQAIDQVTMVLPYGSDEAFEHIRRNRNRLAAIIVEAVQGADPSLAYGPWLLRLFAVCREVGVLVILDEVITGFRLAYGGAQEVFSLVPDLVTYGKAIGGGLPMGAVAGRTDIMAVFAGTPAGKGVFYATAFAGNPLGVAAGTATLGHLLAHRAEIYPAMNAAGERLAQRFNAAAAAEELPTTMRAAGSMFRILFSHDAPHAWQSAPTRLRDAEAAFYVMTLNRGILMHAAQRGFLSAAHTQADIDIIVAGFSEALRQVRTDGFSAMHADISHT